MSKVLGTITIEVIDTGHGIETHHTISYGDGLHPTCKLSYFSLITLSEICRRVSLFFTNLQDDRNAD